ncbi:hypothetical protein BH11MYX3_BH11MYX3_15860 [soil metagenome]
MTPVCIAIIDAANARLYSYQGDPPVFREMRDLVHPGRRSKDRDLLRRAVDEPREGHRAQWDHEFAKQIVAECHDLARTRGFEHVIFVASPRVLGELRKVSEPLRRAGVLVDELERDLTGLSSPQIHDRLADAHLLDERARAR